MMLFHVLAPAAILFAGASAQSQSTEGEMRILPITTTGPLGPTPTFSITDSGFMSIPQGETPITTGLTSSGGSSTPTPTVPPSGSRSSSGSAAPLSTSSPGAAPALFVAGDGSPALFAMTLSGLSVVLGFAWTLL